MSLAPLGVEELAELVQSSFGDAPGQKRLCAWLAEQSVGNALLCMALLTELVERGSIRYREGTWVLPQELPQLAKASLAHVLEQHLSGLDQTARTLASCLSVRRGALSQAVCHAFGQLVLLAAKQTDAALSVLVAERVLVSDRGQYAFAHEHLRVILYEGLERDLRRRAHRCLGEQLAQVGTLADADKVAVGCQFVLAGDPVRAEQFLGNQSVGEQLDELTRAVPDLLTLLEDSRRRGLSEDRQLLYTTPLVLAGLYVDPALHDRLGERTASLLERRSGMNVARVLYPYTGSLIAVLFGLLWAYLWWLCTPKDERWFKFIYPLGALALCGHGRAAGAVLEPSLVPSAGPLGRVPECTRASRGSARTSRRCARAHRLGARRLSARVSAARTRARAGVARAWAPRRGRDAARCVARAARP